MPFRRAFERCGNGDSGDDVFSAVHDPSHGGSDGAGRFKIAASSSAGLWLRLWAPEGLLSCLRAGSLLVQLRIDSILASSMCGGILHSWRVQCAVADAPLSSCSLSLTVMRGLRTGGAFAGSGGVGCSGGCFAIHEASHSRTSDYCGRLGIFAGAGNGAFMSAGLGSARSCRNTVGCGDTGCASFQRGTPPGSALGGNGLAVLLAVRTLAF